MSNYSCRNCQNFFAGKCEVISDYFKQKETLKVESDFSCGMHVRNTPKIVKEVIAQYKDVADDCLGDRLYNHQAFTNFMNYFHQVKPTLDYKTSCDIADHLISHYWEVLEKRRITVIKVVKVILDCGIKEAKDYTDKIYNDGRLAIIRKKIKLDKIQKIINKNRQR